MGLKRSEASWRTLLHRGVRPALVMIRRALVAETHHIIALRLFAFKALLLSPPHAIQMKLQGRDYSNVVMDVLGTGDLSGLLVVVGSSSTAHSSSQN